MNSTWKFSHALLMMFFILFMIFYSLFILKTEPHLPLFVSIILLALLSRWKGMNWRELEEGIIKGIQNGGQPIIILSLIGMLIGAWMISGTIPTITVWTLTFFQPESFFIAAIICCMIISTLIGSTFTTVSTIGVALMGVAQMANIPLEIAAAAIICGATFGDKMSPMSDTTNFASGVATVNIFTHIRHMLYTTLPSLFITVIFFMFISLKLDVQPETTANLLTLKDSISHLINIHFLTILSPILVIALALMKKPVIPSLIAGIVSAGFIAYFIQGISVAQFLQVLQNGPSISSGLDEVDRMINRGGLQSMMWSISLIMIAFAFGGLLEKTGIIHALLEGLKKQLKTKGQVILSTVLSSIGVNLVTGEQYLSILIPGQSFKEMYRKYEIPLPYLSRAVEDAGTLINPLIPWGVSGAFLAATLGVDVIDYLPYAVFLYVSPIFSILFGFRLSNKAKEHSLKMKKVS
ncbi:Na+/H+ antiporter NhaC [Aeribacillus alveayuensis]|uniref:NhaC family Na+:H+ antiporter n=1 Tax=Aeribacillus alveayuensis TaxID=279215 RepID=A0ABT9VPP9_9BACI|nr:NhaC family Na+:H+ antiporter [Bacillus alveayuensis]